MTQNIYDDPTFFAAYGRLERSLHGLDGAPEWPALRALLPEVGARRVLDLGCGYGWFCRWASENGAARVVGIDVLQRLPAQPIWPVDHYFHEGPRTTNWLVEGVLRQHRMLGTYFAMLRAAGFTVTHVVDWGPTREQVAARPDWATELERPQLLLMAAVRA